MRPTWLRCRRSRSLAKAVSLDLIDGGVREQIARALHEGHLQRTGSGGGLHVPWTQLTDADKESSRAAADAIVEMLATIGCRPRRCDAGVARR